MGSWEPEVVYFRDGVPRTIANLKLNIEGARDGKLWSLLPEGYRERNAGRGYPLPSSMDEIKLIAELKCNSKWRNGGAEYVKRARMAYLAAKDAEVDPMEPDERAHEMALAHKRFNAQVSRTKQAMAEELAKVREKAKAASDSLNDLFELGRRGIRAQMEAHINGQEWQGEKIEARGFRECFRMVTQAVKGFGLPSDQKDKAADAILDEVAASIKARDKALAMAPGGDDGKETVN